MNRILNIVLDARSLTHPNGGIGRYTANLLREFVSLESPHRFFLYSDRPFQLGFPLPKQWKVRTGAVHTRGLSTLFSQAVFPVWTLKDKIDVFEEAAVASALQNIHQGYEQKRIAAAATGGILSLPGKQNGNSGSEVT